MERSRPRLVVIHPWWDLWAHTAPSGLRDDRMALAYQNGSTRVIGGSQAGLLQYWTGGGGAEFVLGAANLDGTPLDTPVPVNTDTSATFQDFSPTRFADIMQRLSKDAPDDAGAFGWISTHPASADRIAAARRAAQD